MSVADDFITAACVPMEGNHASGTLEEAEAILRDHPELSGGSVSLAAVLGDPAAIRGFVSDDPGCATAEAGTHGWDPLTYLCFSRYLRLDRSRSLGFVQAATILLDAGADPNAGWFEPHHEPKPEWESVLYGAAGVAHHAPLTRLLLQRGANPNDAEVTYHTPETHDNAALKELLKSEALTPDSLAIMLLRKADWHDLEGVKLLLERGADPNRATQWGSTPLQNSVLSDNDAAIVELMLDHGGDPRITIAGRSAVTMRGRGGTGVAIAARAGRADLLALFERRSLSLKLTPIERLLAACARNQTNAIREISEKEPEALQELKDHAGEILVSFARVGNTQGVRNLLDLGVDVAGRYGEGNGYFDIAKESTALHVAAWRANHDTVKLLLERGAPVDARDAKGQSPLALAVRACVDSYWTSRRSPESVAALLRAGASVQGVAFPSGYAEVDELLRRQGAGA